MVPFTQIAMLFCPLSLTQKSANTTLILTHICFALI